MWGIVGGEVPPLFKDAIYPSESSQKVDPCPVVGFNSIAICS